MTTSAQPPSVLDVDPTQDVPPLAIHLQRMSKAVGSTPLRIARSYVRLALGAGRISFRDFARLRLFDPAANPDSKLESFVGQRKNRDLCVTANFRHDWLALVADKVAASSYLSAYGLPLIPFKAIYAPSLRTAHGSILENRAALDTFLSTPSSYPLFGKPVDGFQSLGSIALRQLGPSMGEVERLDGSVVALSDLAAEIETHFQEGYVFQELARPHHRVAQLCGQRLACVRVVTALFEEGPRVLRAALKIPAGANSADNYWRAGNLLAQIDLQSGQVRRAFSGVGLATQEHAQHPDTGTPLIGFEYPQWAEVKELALDGARVMQHVPLIGWDIASTERGPVIVEMNATPDLFLVQFADRRGMLDPEFQAFMAFQAGQSKAHLRKMKARLRKL